MEVTLESSRIPILSSMTRFEKKTYEELFFEVGRKNHPIETTYISCLSRGISSKDPVLNYYIHQNQTDEFKIFYKFSEHCFNEFCAQNILLKELRKNNIVGNLLEATCNLVCNETIPDIIDKYCTTNNLDNITEAALRKEIYMSRGTRMENEVIDKLATLLTENKKVNDIPFTLKVSKCLDKMKRELFLLPPDENRNNFKIFIVGKTDVRYDVLDTKDEILPKICYGEIKNRISDKRWPPSKDNQLQIMFYMFLYDVDMMFLISHYPDGSIERYLLEWNGTLFQEACSQLKTFTCRYFDDIQKIRKTMIDNKRDMMPSELEKEAISVFIRNQTNKREKEIQQGIKSTVKLL